MLTEQCEICGSKRKDGYDYIHKIHTQEGLVEVCEECWDKYLEEEARKLEEERKRLADDKIVRLINHISVLNAILTKEKAEKAKLERKYSRYYHLVDDFYAYLGKLGKIKEFTLFHEENEIKREGKDGRT